MADYQLLGDPPGDNDYIPSPPNHIPDGWTIQSGGGISNMYHGYYQGPYSSRATRSDVYGESLPYPNIGNQETTITNLYNYDDVTNMRPRDQQEMDSLYEPPYSNTQAGANIDYPYGPQVVYDTKEGFTKDYEMLEDYSGVQSSAKTIKDKLHPVAVFVLIVIFIVALDAWTNTANSFIKKSLFKHKKMNTKNYLMIAVIITALLILMSYLFGASLTWFEKS